MFHPERALLDHDWVMWVDDDVYFTRWSAESVVELLAGAEAEGLFMTSCLHPLCDPEHTIVVWSGCGMVCLFRIHYVFL